ncbi:MAG: putative monovalent cation/H+ antiporter subunit A [Sphaerobacteraceae bacterium]|nr:MAG: putative monovalent cation/H+ antiporter subunit A [Sphaerobacteraceae bacterium]
MLVAVLSGFLVALAAPWLTRWFGDRVGWVIALLPLSITIYLLTFIPDLADGGSVRYSIEWIPALNINLSFHVDGLGLVFALLISGIGTLIMLYGGGYLQGHHQLGRFYLYILMFMASMLGVVLADNIITFFVFFELTSLTSYLLIGFDHNASKSRYSARQALLVTGIGGQFLLVGLILLAIAGGGWEFSVLVDQADVIQDHALYVPIMFLILGGAFTKSAQVPFHFWLPGAMAAPTPVSAYLHSATMVKAGVYLMARINPTIGGTDLWQFVLVTFGAATMLLGAYLAVQRTDLKQLLAYTTVSSLGTLTLLIGIGTDVALKAAMVFLVVHSLYKGALFMVAGTIDHETGTRDIRVLGGLRKLMPITSIGAAVAALSMAGIPPLFGFIGKELVYEAVLDLDTFAIIIAVVAVVSNILMVVVAGITGIQPFIGEEKETPKHAHEAPASLYIGPLVLGTLSLVVGAIPALIDTSIMEPAVSAVAGQPVEVTLYIWHGVNAMLIMSIITVAVGVVVFMGRQQLRSVTNQTNLLAALGPEAIYAHLLAGLDWLSRTQTKIIQNGYLRFYFLTIIVVLVVSAIYPLMAYGNIQLAGDLSDVRIYEWVVVAIVLMSAIMAVRAQSRLAAVAALGIVGYGVATIYILYGAPDLAMTQILVETLTVILFVLVLYRLPQFATLSERGSRIRDAIIAGTGGLLMTLLVLVVSNERFYDSISQFHAEESYPSAFGRNVVNVILVDFRAIDTFGEIIVLAVAGIGVYALLRLRLWEDRSEEK